MTKFPGIVYMGTPGFAVPPLKMLLDEGYPIRGVVTAPDKPGGRGNRLLTSEVKKFALSRNLKILQPANLKDPGFLAELSSLRADLQVVVAFRMLPEAVWRMPSRGTFNLHASLLPQYRGAAPINRVVMNGEKITGVTTFFINENIDTGRIIMQEKVSIPEHFTAGDLHDVLMVEGAELVLKTVQAIQNNDFREIPQEELVRPGEILKSAPKLFREDCRINWNDKVINIYNFIRGLCPSPAAFTELCHGEQAEQVRIFNVAYRLSKHDLPPGKIITEGKEMIKVAVKDGFIIPQSLQLAGKKRLDAKDFINGYRDLEKYWFR